MFRIVGLGSVDLLRSPFLVALFVLFVHYVRVLFLIGPFSGWATASALALSHLAPDLCPLSTCFAPPLGSNHVPFWPTHHYLLPPCNRCTLLTFNHHATPVRRRCMSIQPGDRFCTFHSGFWRPLPSAKTCASFPHLLLTDYARAFSLHSYVPHRLFFASTTFGSFHTHLCLIVFETHGTFPHTAERCWGHL